MPTQTSKWSHIAKFESPVPGARLCRSHPQVPIFDFEFLLGNKSVHSMRLMSGGDASSAAGARVSGSRTSQLVEREMRAQRQIKGSRLDVNPLQDTGHRLLEQDHLWSYGIV